MAFQEAGGGLPDAHKCYPVYPRPEKMSNPNRHLKVESTALSNTYL